MNMLLTRVGGGATGAAGVTPTILYPDGTISTNWAVIEDEVGTPTEWEVLRLANPEEPTAPDTSDYITSSNSGEISISTMQTTSIGANVTQFSHWAYAEKSGAEGPPGNNEVIMSYRTDGGAWLGATPIIFTAFADPGVNFAWFNTIWSVDINQANLDALQIKMEADSFDQETRISKMYVKIS